VSPAFARKAQHGLQAKPHHSVHSHIVDIETEKKIEIFYAAI
jgi:hypothetical protein